MHGNIIHSEALPGNEPPPGGTHPYNPISPWPIAEMGDSVRKHLGTKMPQRPPPIGPETHPAYENTGTHNP